MANPILSTLSEATRRELSICGITTDAQLRQVTPERILRDLEQAREFFPDESFQLTPEEINQLFAQLRSEQPMTTETAPQQAPQPRVKRPRLTDTFRRAKQPKAPQRQRDELRSGITARYPLTFWFGALSALLMPLFFPALIAGAYILLFTDYRPLGESPYPYMLLPLVLLVPHLIMARLSLCSVCHMPMFAYRPYPHHRKAHHIPLLGVAFPSALHALFCLRLRCPACGTPQRLYGTPGSFRRKSS